MTIVVATLTVACSQDPYERYASAVRADASTAVLTRAIARLQLTTPTADTRERIARQLTAHGVIL